MRLLALDISARRRSLIQALSTDCKLLCLDELHRSFSLLASHPPNPFFRYLLTAGRLLSLASYGSGASLQYEPKTLPISRTYASSSTARLRALLAHSLFSLAVTLRSGPYLSKSCSLIDRYSLVLSQAPDIYRRWLLISSALRDLVSSHSLQSGQRISRSL